MGATILGTVIFFAWTSSDDESFESARTTSATTKTLTQPALEPTNDSWARVAQIPNLVDKSDQVIDVSLAEGMTLLGVLVDLGIPISEAFKAATSVEALVDPRTLRAGQTIQVALTEESNGVTRLLRSIVMAPETDRVIVVNRKDGGEYTARLKQVEHISRLQFADGTIKESLHEAARALDIPSSILEQAYPILGHAVDLQRDIKNGDRFSFAFEKFEDAVNHTSHTGALVFISLEADERTLSLVRFTTGDGFTGYFDSNGNSIEASLRRTPVDGARLSSRFGKRDHPILGYSRMHKGLDFAASHGSPVFAAGDGLVVKRGFKGSFGNYVRIRHAGALETAYGHLSEYAADLKVGSRVRQGDTIGFIGATGLATGPNLHYEVLKNGIQINPMRLDLPPRKKLAPDELARLRREIASLRKKISGA
ncbi:MAG: M23 family metallopeptidase [Alphaproteobacteria bacterium]